MAFLAGFPIFLPILRARADPRYVTGKESTAMLELLLALFGIPMDAPFPHKP